MENLLFLGVPILKHFRVQFVICNYLYKPLSNLLIYASQYKKNTHLEVGAPPAPCLTGTALGNPPEAVDAGVPTTENIHCRSEL